MNYVIDFLNVYFIDPYILRTPSPVVPYWPSAVAAKAASLNKTVSEVYADDSIFQSPYSPLRQLLVTWTFLYIGSVILYFLFCSLTYYIYYIRENKARWKFEPGQIRNEIFTSMWSMVIMAGLTAPIEVAVIYGHTRVYHRVEDYGWLYFFFSVPLFLVFTDSLIYWIHRGLHHPLLYFIHKLHHRYKETTPYSAFSFHPLDGWSQGLPYHLFVLVFPMHNLLYFFSVFVVGLWTMNIHDRVTFDWWGVNGAAHHTIHHTKFNYNYGQYFTVWDRICGTYMDPYMVSPYKEMKSASAPQSANGVPISKKTM